MKLIYRGITYDYNPSKTPTRPFQPVRESRPAYDLSYRGVRYRIEPNAKAATASVLPSTYNLIYRGVSYCVNRTAPGEVTIVPQPTSAFNPLASFWKALTGAQQHLCQPNTKL